MEIGRFLYSLSSVVLVLDLGREVVPDVADVADLVLDDEGDLGAHGEADLGRQAGGLGEHVEVSAREGQGDGLLHVDGDGLLLLVDVGGLGELDIAHSDVTGSGELDALLGAGYDDGLTKLGQIPDLRGKV